jgi:hypothetical protein
MLDQQTCSRVAESLPNLTELGEELGLYAEAVTVPL